MALGIWSQGDIEGIYQIRKAGIFLIERHDWGKWRGGGCVCFVGASPEGLLL
jgi:hypothetical protein